MDLPARLWVGCSLSLQLTPLKTPCIASLSLVRGTSFRPLTSQRTRLTEHVIQPSIARQPVLRASLTSFWTQAGSLNTVVLGILAVWVSFVSNQTLAVHELNVAGSGLDHFQKRSLAQVSLLRDPQRQPRKSSRYLLLLSCTGASPSEPSASHGSIHPPLRRNIRTAPTWTGSRIASALVRAFHNNFCSDAADDVPDRDRPERCRKAWVGEHEHGHSSKREIVSADARRGNGPERASLRAFSRRRSGGARAVRG